MLHTFLFCLFFHIEEIPHGNILQYETVVGGLDSISCLLHKIEIDHDVMEIAFRKAMTFYPELCERKIRIKYGKISTSMAAYPQIISVFRKRENRTYKVILTKNPQQLIYDASFDAWVGIMGHELAHILDYTDKSGFQLAWTGVRYLGKNYRRNMERQTDLVTIERGLGWQLYSFKYFLAYEAVIDDKYRQYMLDTYMKPEEIFEIINR